MVSLVYKETLKVTLERQTHPLKGSKGGRSQQLSKEEIQVAHKHMKRCSVWSGSGNTDPKHSEIPFYIHQRDLNTASARDSIGKFGLSDMSGGM